MFNLLSLLLKRKEYGVGYVQGPVSSTVLSYTIQVSQSLGISGTFEAQL
jgi:hypothetical protein